MQKRKLGRSDLVAAPWCLGGNVFGWTADEATSFKLLDAFLDAGFDFIDTADIYSRWVPGHVGGESETIIGKWLTTRNNRSRVVIATKVGMSRDAGPRNLAKSYIIESVEASLRRLQTDYIDLYQSHQDDPGRPVEEPLEAFAQLIQAGKVRVIGASNFGVERLTAALEASQRRGLPRYETLQPEYNLYAREGFESGLQQLCVEHGVSAIPYFSLASGFLTGKYRSDADFAKSPRGDGMAKFLNQRGYRILTALDRVAEQHRATPAQVALAWLMAQPAVAAPIASATSVEQLQSLAAAARLALSTTDLDELRRASA